MFIRTIRKLSRQDAKQHQRKHQKQHQTHNVSDNAISPFLGNTDSLYTPPRKRRDGQFIGIPPRFRTKSLGTTKTDGPGVSNRKTSLPNTGVGGVFSSTDGKQKLSSIQGKGSNSNWFPSQSIMPPISEDLTIEVQKLIEANDVVIFSKTTCPFCAKAKDLLKSLNVKFESLELDVIEKGPKYQAALKELTGQSTVPNIFIHGQHLGGSDSLLKKHSENKLPDILAKKIPIKEYDCDLIVIGGGSGGLAASKEAASLGKKVTLFDFVTPSPPGTTWGLGGTCVNVGCIPKKLMHRTSILGEDIEDARQFGWEFSDKVHHNWITMKDGIQDHIGSLNWGYRVSLRDNKVNYINGYAQIVDKNTVKTTLYPYGVSWPAPYPAVLNTELENFGYKGVKKNKQEVTLTAEHILIATGERPRYPDIPGAREYCVTSDDLFSLPYSPGKTLCVGASYVALECAGFLAGVGLDTTVMVRSILLRGFDQQCAEVIGRYMEKNGVKFIRGAVPTKIEQMEAGEPGRYKVTAKTTEGEEIVEEYNTILIAIGRDPCTNNIGLENIGVQLSEKSKRVLVNEREQTNIPNVYAIGDIGEGRPELTPVAIKAGKLLARRLFQPKDQKKVLVDYNNVPTTVFTPLEYGCIGYSEEAAIAAFGDKNTEVYHSYFQPLEWTVPHKDDNQCYAKLVCKKDEDEKVIGFHVLGPNAGEITQGYAVAMKKGATKADFDDTIGIHPTNSEVFTTLKVTKRSGDTAEVTGC